MSLGCDFEKKSFTVPMGSVSGKSACCKCNKPTSGTYRWNREPICKECFGKKPKAKNEGASYASKDMLWNFNVDDGAKTIEIRSKGMFDKYCKKKGLNWRNVKQGVRKKQDHLKNKHDKPVDRKEMADFMLSQAKQNGLYEALKFKDLKRRNRRR